MKRNSNTIADANVAMDIHSIHYCIHIKSRGKWGHQDKLLQGLHALQLELIDFKIFNDIPYVEDLIYVKDTESLLNAANDHQKLSKRVKYIKRSLKIALQDKNAQINIMRWIPGVTPNANDTDNTDNKQISYNKNEAYKEARAQLSNMELLQQHRLITTPYNDQILNEHRIHNACSDELIKVDDNGDGNEYIADNSMICSHWRCKKTAIMQCQNCLKFVCQTHRRMVKSKNSSMFDIYCKKCKKHSVREKCGTSTMTTCGVMAVAAAFIVIIL